MATAFNPKDSRREARAAVACKASARIALSVELIDISRQGVRARISVPLPVGAMLKIKLPDGVERHARVVWARDDLVGCEFLAPLDPKEIARLPARD